MEDYDELKEFTETDAPIPADFDEGQGETEEVALSPEEEFEKILLSIKEEEPGVEKLLKRLKKSDFFSAPASTEFGAETGGLVRHSVGVYKLLREKLRGNGALASAGAGVSEASIVKVGLLHDIGLIETFARDTRNKKSYDPEAIRAIGNPKTDEHGQPYVWVTEPFFKYIEEPALPMAPGEKSLYMIMACKISLTPGEAEALLCNSMGEKDTLTFQERKALWSARKKDPALVLGLYEANMEDIVLHG